jgi:hypothetical protein
LVLPFVVITACNAPLEPQPERLGYDYFPLKTGTYKIYDVSIINYNIDGSTDTINYQLQEIIADSSTVGEEISYRLDRYRRADATEFWVIDSVWSARRNTYQGVVVEHNIPFIKLSFPLVEDKRWDGNALNTIDFDEYKIKNLGSTYQVNGTDYPNSLEMYVADQLDPLQITSDDYHLEVFSSGVGLVYIQKINKKYCSPIDCPEPGVIEEGKEYEQKLVKVGEV